jgi:hypothetical protein
LVKNNCFFSIQKVSLFLLGDFKHTERKKRRRLFLLFGSTQHAAAAAAAAAVRVARDSSSFF